MEKIPHSPDARYTSEKINYINMAVVERGNLYELQQGINTAGIDRDQSFQNRVN